MAERVSGPYRGYYISVSARLVPARSAASQPAIGEGIYVGAVSVSQRGPDDPHRIETLLELGDERRFATEDDALLHAEQAARDYIDRLLTAV
jgi:predicted aminopeptidase